MKIRSLIHRWKSRARRWANALRWWLIGLLLGKSGRQTIIVKAGNRQHVYRDVKFGDRHKLVLPELKKEGVVSHDELGDLHTREIQAMIEGATAAEGSDPFGFDPAVASYGRHEIDDDLKAALENPGQPYERDVKMHRPEHLTLRCREHGAPEVMRDAQHYHFECGCKEPTPF